METNHLLSQKQGPVLSLTLNRPESLNAFSPEMIIGLTEAVRGADQDESIRAIVISGAGRAFSAGGDVKTMAQATPELVHEHVGKMNECVLAISNAAKPVIAVVHGFAAGAGFNLALACDLIVAAEDAKFVLSFAQVGLTSDCGGSFFLPQIVGPHVAKELFFSAEPIPASRALALGIVNRTVPPEKLQEEAVSFAIKIAQGPSRAFASMKALVNQSFSSSLEDILALEQRTQTELVTTYDFVEGVRAFGEKRRPQFLGK